MASVDVYPDLSMDMYADMYADGWSSAECGYRIGMRNLFDGCLLHYGTTMLVGVSISSYYLEECWLSDLHNSSFLTSHGVGLANHIFVESYYEF